MQGVVAERSPRTDDRLLEAALEQYPEQAPAIAITYGHLELFREQLARFGPQVVPIVAAYQRFAHAADALQIAGQALEQVGSRLGGEPRRRAGAADAGGARADRAAQDARRGQCLRRPVGDHRRPARRRRVPSRLVTLAGPELLLGGLTALERGIVQEREIDWQTYGLAAVDLAAIASGVALLRFAGAARAGRARRRRAAGRAGHAPLRRARRGRGRWASTPSDTACRPASSR